MNLLRWSQMERAQELAIIRRAYAKQILAAAQVDNAHLEQALAQVPREDSSAPDPG
jgi:protein-L-isoaspartate(D-aspartate) O-methyltransferase